MKHSKKVLNHSSFTYRTLDYCAKTKEYILEHIVTKQTRRISEEHYNALYREQSTSQPPKK